MKKRVAIIDYGLGNIVSAQQSFIKDAKENSLNVDVVITNDVEIINDSTHIVLPGQGAFNSCIEGLRSIDGMIDSLENNVLNKKKPFLGICVGMQLLAEEGRENGTHDGLGWIKGSTKKLQPNNMKLPHMGWNNVNVINKNFDMDFPIDNLDFYFVHSYYFDCFDKKNIIATTDYDLSFPSIVGKENIYGVQFHPEKSSNQGLRLINSFLKL